jgi:hypothetical protein
VENDGLISLILLKVQSTPLRKLLGIFAFLFLPLNYGKKKCDRGEMERDCMLSHGSVQFLKERTFDCSDKYYVWIDKETGMISPVNPEKNIYKSLYSENTTRFAKVQIPYASKLFFQELQSMHIVPRINTK